MKKKSTERTSSSSFDENKLLLLAERKAQGDTRPISDEDVCVYAERNYRHTERMRVVDALHKEVITLIRRNEGDYGEGAIEDFRDALKKCVNDIERVRVCSGWLKMYRGLRGVTNE